jgi:hypothetical protein
MKARCDNPNNPAWPVYGGKGITYRKRWRKFEVFLADMGPKPSPDHYFRRLDTADDFTPDNCVWATLKEIPAGAGENRDNARRRKRRTRGKSR